MWLQAERYVASYSGLLPSNFDHLQPEDAVRTLLPTAAEAIVFGMVAFVGVSGAVHLFRRATEGAA